MVVSIIDPTAARSVDWLTRAVIFLLGAGVGLFWGWLITDAVYQRSWKKGVVK